METKKISVVAHGGAGSDNEHSDGTEKAVETCHKAMQKNMSLIQAKKFIMGIINGH